MQDSQTPTKIQLPWGASAGGSYIRTVPVPSQIGSQNGAASFTDGFPPNCFIPLATGGAGPFGSDMNGVLNQISAGTRWSQAGGPYFYDSVFSAAVGGYPKGAMLANAATPGLFWISTVENNTSNPDTGGANWLSFGIPIFLNTQVDGILPLANSNVKILLSSATPGSHTFTVPANTFSILGECLGAGGGGAGASSSFGGGCGAAGGYIVVWFSVNPGDTVTYVVGAPGAGGAAGADGTGGGSSSISNVAGAVCASAGGGGGAIVASQSGGFGGGVVISAGTGHGTNGGDGSDGGSLAISPGLGGASWYGGGTRSHATGVIPVAALGSGGGGGYGTSSVAGLSGGGGGIVLWG